MLNTINTIARIIFKYSNILKIKIHLSLPYNWEPIIRNIKVSVTTAADMRGLNQAILIG